MLTYTQTDLDRARRDGTITKNGVWFRMQWLDVRGSAAIALFKEPRITDTDIALAAKELRRTHCAVQFSIQQPERHS